MPSERTTQNGQSQDSDKNNSESIEGVNLSFRISQGIGNTFYRVGFFVSSNPVRTIIASILFTLICSSGFFYFRAEKNPLKLWIPQESKFLRDTDWVMKTFQEGYREQQVLITATDVLEPYVLQKLLLISKEVNKFQIHLDNGTSYGWSDICFKIPIIRDLAQYMPKKGRGRRSPSDGSFDDFDDEFDATFKEKEEKAKEESNEDRKRPFQPSVHMATSWFCSVINKLPLGCMLNNLLELWDFDETKINKLTKDDILNALHDRNVSLTTGHESNFVHLLSGIERNRTGHIVSATGLLSNWMVYVNFSNVNHEKIGNMAGTEDWASEEALIWENEFLEILKKYELTFANEEVEVYFSAGRSYGDISAATMFQDMTKVSMGSILMFIYMTLILSKFGWTELRVMLGGLGLLCVGMAFVAAIGICSFFGISYGPVHTSLPFLLMGLGVDDIFVLMACWRRIQSELQPLKHAESIPERMGLMLKTAGASITVTSFTDIVAFSVGSITVLPSLQSFCRYAAVGVLLTWAFAITFFIAIFTIDERRILANRNSIIPCIVHAPAQTKLWWEPNLFYRMLSSIFKQILTKPGKIIVLMSTVGMTAFSLKGLMNLEQKFDPAWFIPSDTYLNKFIMEKRALYPDQGYEAMILMGRLNYTNELNKIRDVIVEVENRTDLVHEMTNWLMPFHDFVLLYHDKDIFEGNVTDLEFRTFMTQFLLSQNGGKFQANIRFERKLECGEPSPNIKVSTINFKYKRFGNRSGYVPAMHTMGNIVREAGFSSGDAFSTVWGKVYGNWVTDEVIDTELIRNLIVALICVWLCTIVLIANVYICFWIFICILLTLINVCGGLYLWGLTIDLVSCIGLQLAVGLCVDYAAHVGHTFLTITDGTESERAYETVMHIGPAVLNGGISTILAMAMLANSDAYTFQAFFKIFLLVIAFGLYHGIFFFPVVLSIVGPKPYRSTNKSRSNRTPIIDTNQSNELGTEMRSFISNGNDEKENPTENNHLNT